MCILCSVLAAIFLAGATIRPIWTDELYVYCTQLHKGLGSYVTENGICTRICYITHFAVHRIVVFMCVVFKNISSKCVAMVTQKCVVWGTLVSVWFSYICRCLQCKMHLGLHGNCLMFLSNFNQLWIYSTDFNRSAHFQISRKCEHGRRADTWGTWRS